MASQAESPSGLRKCLFCGRVGCGTESCPNRIYDLGTVAEGICLRCGKGGPGNLNLAGKVVEGVVVDAYCELCGDHAAPRAAADSPAPSSITVDPATYSITVDYDRTLAEMIEAGHYREPDGSIDDPSNSGITAENYPIEGSGTVERETVLVHFDRPVSAAEAESGINKSGLRPARIEELLAFGAAYPEVQREFSVVELGSVTRDSRDLVFLWGNDYRRNLGNAWADTPKLDADYRFLAVRE